MKQESINLIGLSAEELQALRTQAAEQNISRLELIRRIIRQALASKKASPERGLRRSEEKVMREICQYCRKDEKEVFLRKVSRSADDAARAVVDFNREHPALALKSAATEAFICADCLPEAQEAGWQCL